MDSNQQRPGQLFDFAPTEKRLTFHGLTRLRILGGKIVRFDGYSDTFETLAGVTRTRIALTEHHLHDHVC